MISETNIDDNFPIGNFLIHSLSPLYRLDYASKGDGIMFYIREDIPTNLLAIDKKPIESFYVELNKK